MCAEKDLMVQKPAFCICGTFCVRVVVCVCKSLFRMALLAILHFPAVLDTFIEIYSFISTADSPYPSWTHICMQLTLFFFFFAIFRLFQVTTWHCKTGNLICSQRLSQTIFEVFPLLISLRASSSSALLWFIIRLWRPQKRFYPHWTPTQPARCALTLFHDSTWHLFISFGSRDWHHFLEEVTTLRENMTTRGLTGKSVNNETISRYRKHHELKPNLSKHDWDATAWPSGHFRNLNHVLCSLSDSPHIRHLHTSC